MTRRQADPALDPTRLAAFREADGRWHDYGPEAVLAAADWLTATAAADAGPRTAAALTAATVPLPALARARR